MKNYVIIKIGFVILFATIFGANFFGKNLARQYCGILTYFSFQNGPFSWSYNYNVGIVGPFAIGSYLPTAIIKISNSDSEYIMFDPSSNKFGENINSINASSMSSNVSAFDGDLAFRTYKDGAEVIYIVGVSGGYINYVRASGSFFNGL